ncbi:hypothetical protein [Rhodalgimonas zhirmunskyi]|uniref:Secreted protein n=1 Tax=Rhodalgimonas zhirmunskyi TaxID=2964767 RepID=A0AAJ1X4Q9_9RHOB|nr:hypothetical protein [Rhodoalgimonas zhirmunskyi]MDQ2092769.1 hypothetical protein [Rhodoalgimonas zhirmunskyi]
MRAGTAGLMMGLMMGLIAGGAQADYACRFDAGCGDAAPCPETIALALGEDGWTATRAPGDRTLPMILNPEAGTYFAHVFIGAEGFADGVEAVQLSINRDGAALYTRHKMRGAPEAMTLTGQCEVVG